MLCNYRNIRHNQQAKKNHVNICSSGNQIIITLITANVFALFSGGGIYSETFFTAAIPHSRHML